MRLFAMGCTRQTKVRNGFVIDGASFTRIGRSGVACFRAELGENTIF
jgi:hypothetical protein